MKKGSLAGILIFGLFWTALVGAFDSFVGYNLYRQLRARGFAQTTGTVTASEVTRHRGSKGGTTYGVAIQYDYTVNGASFSGDRYRYGTGSSSDSAWAHAAVRQNPVGAQITVFYDPQNPADSLLSRGIGGSDLFLVLFLTPFNLVMLGLWAAGFSRLRWRGRMPVAGGVKWFDDGRVIRVRLPRFSPAIAGMVTLGLGSFLSIFVIAFGGSGFHPSLGRVLGIGGTVLLGALGVSLWQWRKQAAGQADLLINALERTVELPATFGRKTRITLPCSALTGITVETIARRGSKGGTSYTYAVTLQAAGTPEKLTEWYDSDRAEALAAWLRERIPLGEPEAPPRKTQWQDSMPVA